ncbi:MAG: hypothetical protein ACRYGM_01735 [Janthinobacterium lividum]
MSMFNNNGMVIAHAALMVTSKRLDELRSGVSAGYWRCIEKRTGAGRPG